MTWVIHTVVVEQTLPVPILHFLAALGVVVHAHSVRLRCSVPAYVVLPMVVHCSHVAFVTGAVLGTPCCFDRTPKPRRRVCRMTRVHAWRSTRSPTSRAVHRWGRHMHRSSCVARHGSNGVFYSLWRHGLRHVAHATHGTAHREGLIGSVASSSHARPTPVAAVRCSWLGGYGACGLRGVELGVVRR